MGKIEKMIEEGKYESLYPLAQIEDFDSFQRLKESIKKSGILNPIYYIEPVGKILKIVNGNTRIKAVKKLKEEGIEVKLPLKAVSKDEAAGIYLAENLQDLRKPYTRMQRAFVGVYYFYENIKKQADQNMASGANGRPIKTAVEVANQCGSNEKYVLEAKKFLNLFDKNKQKIVFEEIIKERADFDSATLKMISADDVPEILSNISNLQIKIKEIAERKRNQATEENTDSAYALQNRASRTIYEIKGIKNLNATKKKDFNKKMKALLKEFGLEGSHLVVPDGEGSTSQLGQEVLADFEEV